MGVTFVIPQRYGCVLTIMSMEKNVDFLDWSGVALQTAATRPHGGNSPTNQFLKKPMPTPVLFTKVLLTRKMGSIYFRALAQRESSLLDRPNCGQYPIVEVGCRMP